jgi:PIN domain nuclease of toxin-antitoxin system
MRLLLDTSALLLALSEPERLSVASRSAIEDPASTILVSAASVWEIAIKRALGKLEAPESVVGAIQDAGFETLDIAPEHAERAGGQPPHHRDPFDRMLVAQALAEGCTLLTRDDALRDYDVEILRA